MQPPVPSNEFAGCHGRAQPATPNHVLAGEIERALRVINPGFSSCGLLTFSCRGEFSCAAANWRSGQFAPVALPAFLDALAFARDGLARELIDVEERLSCLQSPEVFERLIRQGVRLTDAAGVPRGDRLFRKILSALETQRLRGNFIVLFAARCALFSFPDRTAVGALILQEYLAGAPDTPAALATQAAAECIHSIDFPMHKLRAA